MLLSIFGSLEFPAAALAVEAIARGWGKSSLRRLIKPDNSQWADIFCLMAYGTSFVGLVVGLSSFGLSYWFAVLLTRIYRPLHALKISNPILALAVFSFAQFFLNYWVHRAFHSKYLWHFHRFHHSATDMNPLVQVRNHPIEIAVTNPLIGISSGLIAVPPEYAIAFNMLFQFYLFLIHADLPWEWGWFGRWVMQSPHGHRIHHSSEIEHREANYGNLVILDRLFGTYYGGSEPVKSVGVDDCSHNHHGPVYDLSADYVAAVKEVFRPVMLVTRAALRRSPDARTKQPPSAAIE